MKDYRSDLANANQPITQRAIEKIREHQGLYKFLQYENVSPR